MLERICDGRTDLVFDYVSQGHAATSRDENGVSLIARCSTPFDIYSGEEISEGKKSVAYRIVFQSDRTTLTSEQVDRAQDDILRQLERELGAQLRG